MSNDSEQPNTSDAVDAAPVVTVSDAGDVQVDVTTVTVAAADAPVDPVVDLDADPVEPETPATVPPPAPTEDVEATRELAAIGEHQDFSLLGKQVLEVEILDAPPARSSLPAGLVASLHAEPEDRVAVLAEAMGLAKPAEAKPEPAFHVLQLVHGSLMIADAVQFDGPKMRDGAYQPGAVLRLPAAHAKPLYARKVAKFLTALEE